MIKHPETEQKVMGKFSKKQDKQLLYKGVKIY